MNQPSGGALQLARSQYRPLNVRPQLLALDRAAGRPLDRWAVLGWDALTVEPHGDKAGAHANLRGQGGLRVADRNRSFQGLHGDAFNHKRDVVVNTNEITERSLIGGMEKKPTQEQLAFASRLKTARLARNWTQQQLADAAGLTQSAIGNMEKAQRQPRAMLKLVLALRVSPQWLETGDGPMEPASSVARPDVLELMQVLETKPPDLVAWLRTIVLSSDSLRASAPTPQARPSGAQTINEEGFASLRERAGASEVLGPRTPAHRNPSSPHTTTKKKPRR